ncbi:hypothetical protein SEA_BYCHANCE_55 [Mycobacterium phage ByChance]|nr:hypothetical protein SEA_BYCHANCE_55 [Mycobacterium phage ByChance]WNT44518.1 hypothetical protein SEA_BLUECRAB_63 [Mycobacterium phage BlueCrab]
MSKFEALVTETLRQLGWTCEYHEPVSDRDECSQCDDSHDKTAAALLEMLKANRIALIELPEPYFVHSATDDVNGYADWEYPHGSIATTDDGTIMWGQWHITDPEKVRAAAAALLAAAAAAEVTE